MRRAILSLLTLLISVPVCFAHTRIQEVGITGIRLAAVGDYRFIAEVLPGAPAAHAGLKAGDYIVAVNDVDTKNLALKDLIHALRGQIGSEVTVTIRRKGSDQLEQLKLNRISLELYKAAEANLYGK